MDSPAFLQQFDSGKALIQTFGRGKLSLQTTNALSERQPQANFINNIFSKELRSPNPKAQGCSKLSAHSQQKRKTNNKENEHKVQRVASTKKGNNAQFQQIDQISHKISDIIKSISTSCHKRVPQSISKTQRIQKSQTTQKISQLHNKYNNTLDSKHQLFHNFKDEPFRPHFQDKSKNKAEPKWFDQVSSKQKTNMNINTKAERQLGCSQTDRQHYNMAQKNDEEYDDIDQRIKQLNHKISKYQHKMAGYQDIYSFNKPTYTTTIKPQIINHNKGEQKDKVDIKKVEKKCLKNTPKIEARTKIEGKDKQYISFDKSKNVTPLTEKKSYFTQKFNQTVRSTKKYESKQLKKDLRQSKKWNPKVLNQQQSRMKFSKGSQAHQPLVNNLAYKSTFIKAIVRQISLDQDFRYAKHMFAGMEELFGDSYNSDGQKWRRLKRQLDNEGLSFSVQEVKEIFMPRDDEIDPFMSVSHSHQQLIHSVVFAYQTAEKHWNDNIYHNWTFWELKQSNFLAERLDRGKKGFICLQDFTFFINTQIEGSYRNRDLMLIFHRLGFKSLPNDKDGMHKLKCKDIMNVLLSE